MPTATETIESLVKQEYKYGFVTDVESESAPPGLSEDTIRLISAKKKEPQWLTDWRLKAYRHWLTMPEPTWQFVKYPKIDFQDITYFSQPKPKGDGAEKSGRGGSEAAGNLRETRHSACASAAGWPAWRWTRCLIP